MNDLFNDDDDSDEELNTAGTRSSAKLATDITTQNPDLNSTTNQTNHNGGNGTSGNSQLFGSDSESEDEDIADDVPSKDSTVLDEAKADGNNETVRLVTEKNTFDVSNDNDLDADVEFKGEDIQGKNPGRKVRPVESTISVEATDFVVPRIPLQQFREKKNNKTFHIAQLSRIINIQPEPFNPETYNASVEDMEFKGKSHGTMIRWRYKKDRNGDFVRDVNNKLVRESNTKIIKWSDGTYGLSVGDEVFNMNEISFGINKYPNSKSPSSKQEKGHSMDFIFLTQKAQVKSKAENVNDYKPFGTVLECVTPLNSKFIPRPTSLQSEAHKNFVLGTRKKDIQRAKIAEYVTFVDPEKEKAERIRNKDDLNRQEKRSGDIGGRRHIGGGRRRYGMHKLYMEEDDEHFDSVNIRSLKRDTMRDDDIDYGNDDMDDYEDEWSRRKRNRKSRHLNNDEDEHEDEFIVHEEEDEEMIAVRKKGTLQKKNHVFADSDSE